MNWKTFPEEKPNYGDIVAIRTAPEQGGSYRATPFYEDTEWIDGDQWLKLNGAKRKPLPDGTLPLTDEELVCIKKMTGAIFALGVKIVYSRLEYVLPNGHFDTKCVESVKVILWLAERFELTSNN